MSGTQVGRKGNEARRLNRVDSISKLKPAYRVYRTLFHIINSTSRTTDPLARPAVRQPSTPSPPRLDPTRSRTSHAMPCHAMQKRAEEEEGEEEKCHPPPSPGHRSQPPANAIPPSISGGKKPGRYKRKEEGEKTTTPVQRLNGTVLMRKEKRPRPCDWRRKGSGREGVGGKRKLGEMLREFFCGIMVWEKSRPVSRISFAPGLYVYMLDGV